MAMTRMTFICNGEVSISEVGHPTLNHAFEDLNQCVKADHKRNWDAVFSWEGKSRAIVVMKFGRNMTVIYEAEA